MKIEEEFSKFTHEVEETFHDVKDNVILAVEQHSLLIALVLMSVTTAVLVIGTVYVWCFHHPSSAERSRSGQQEVKKKRPEKEPKETNHIKGQQKEQNNENDLRFASKESEQKNDDDEVITQDISESQVAKGTEENASEVRKRVPSGSGSVNNNDSPVKSKIPIRRSTSRTKQS